jgi:hypothetical protein
LELIRGDIPTVVKNLTDYFHGLQSLRRTIGSDYLNVQFGWVPLMNDIIKAVEVLFKLHMLLYGSDQRRRSRSGDVGYHSRFVPGLTSLNSTYEWNPFRTSIRSTPYVKNVQSPFGYDVTLGFSPPVISTSRAISVECDYRFSARYHRGSRPNDRERGFIDRATELLGLQLTPEMLWQLTPWTWLLDWASNLGAVAQNLSTLDWSNVLLDYAYLTFCIRTESSVSTVFSPSFTVDSGSNMITVNLNRSFQFQRFSTIEKVREQASPFGFSVSWEALSASQLAILAALGMSRGR